MMNKNAKATSGTKTAIISVVIIVLALVVVVALKSGVTGGAASTTQCNDRIDNDGDARCDYSKNRKSCIDGSTKGDSGCSSSSDNTEASCVPGSTTCGVGECRRTSTCVNDAVSCTPGSPTTETCDGKDNDCDGSVDDNLGSTTCGVGACQRTVQNCVGGVSQTCTSGTPTTEVCNDGIDNDCNGVIDNGCGNPDSCSDSDLGAVYSVQGTVSGYKNNLPYSKTDFCINNATLLEYYCSGTNAVNTSIGCGGNATSYCNNGRCV